MALTSGAKLGPYEIVGALGAGGMGEVYRARDTRLDRTVASIMAVDLDLKNSVPRIGTPKALFPVHLALVSYQNRLGSAWDPFDVSVDGKRVLVNSPDQPQAAEPINVIVNWDAELKK